METDRYKDKMMLSAYKTKERRQQKAFWRKAEAREKGVSNLPKGAFVCSVPPAFMILL